jgi:hypothetical protein
MVFSSLPDRPSELPMTKPKQKAKRKKNAAAAQEAVPLAGCIQAGFLGW